ncbi:NAD(P)/FAD-dependent oxidoreductase [Aliihoeflea sp. PC F10.4]
MKVIIVGAGISGLSTAWALTKRGHEVTIVEQGPIPNPLAASGDHHRIIRRAYGAHLGYATQIDEAFAAWEELWRDLGQSHYDNRGFLCASYEEGDAGDTRRAGLVAGGHPFENVEPGEAARRWPFLNPEGLRYALLSTEGGALHCRRIANGLCEWLRANGADVRENCKVVSVDVDGATVTLENGSIVESDQLVVTAGAWVLSLFPDLAVDLQPYRTAVAYMTPPDDLREAWERAPTLLGIGEAGEGYLIPPSGDGGLKFGTGFHKRATDDPDADRNARPGEGEEISRRMAPTIARLDEYGVSEVMSCVYTFTRDETFYGAAIGHALVVSACSGHGYKFGAAVGRRVADAAESGDIATLRQWLRAEEAPKAV